MRATAPGAGILFALPLIVSLLIPAGALAQLEPSASGLEFETNLSESSLQLSGRETITGLAPLEVPGPLTGEYWLTAEAPRVAPQRGRVTIDLDETGSRIVAYGRPTFRERFIQGLVFPGYAQYRYQDPGKASFFGTAAARRFQKRS